MGLKLFSADGHNWNTRSGFLPAACALKATFLAKQGNSCLRILAQTWNGREQIKRASGKQCSVFLHREWARCDVSSSAPLPLRCWRLRQRKILTQVQTELFCRRPHRPVIVQIQYTRDRASVVAVCVCVCVWVWVWGCKMCAGMCLFVCEYVV